MDKPDLLLDIDGVARNFIAGALPIINELTGRAHGHDDVDQFRIESALKLTDDEAQELYRRIAQEGWCRRLPPYEGSQAGIAKLREVTNVHPVTAPFASQWWIPECEEWLAEHYGIDHHDVVHTNAKHLVAGRYFVEDKTATLVKWRARHPHGVPILFSRKYNVNDGWDGVTVNSWPELTSFVISDIAASKR